MSETTRVLRLSYRRVIGLAAGLACINAIFLAGTAFSMTSFQAIDALPSFWQGMVQYVLAQFNLTTENVLAAWYSSMLLLLVSFAALTGYLADRRLYSGRSRRLVAAGWYILGLAFVLMSIDELGSIHERLVTPGASDGLRWILIALLPAGFFILGFLLIHLRRQPLSLLLFILGLVLAASVPIQEKIEVQLLSSGAIISGQRPVLGALLEEGSEIFASLLFITAFGLYAVWAARRDSLETGRPAEIPISLDPRLAARIGAVGLTVLGGALLLALVISPAGTQANRDALWTAQSFDAAVRGHDSNLATALAAPNVELKIAPPPAGETGVYQGSESLGAWVQLAQAQGLQIRQYSLQGEANTITWRGTVIRTDQPNQSATPAWMTSQVTVDQGKITSYALDFSPGAGEVLGIIENWFPSSLAVLAGISALAFGMNEKRQIRQRFVLLAAFCLLVSAYFGSNGPAYQSFGDLEPLRQVAKGFLSATAILFGTFVIGRTPGTRAGFVVGWMILLTISFWVSSVAAAPLAFLACASLTFALASYSKLSPVVATAPVEIDPPAALAQLANVSA